MIEQKEDALAKLEEAKLHVAYLKEKTAWIKTFWRTALQTQPILPYGDRIQQMHGDVFYSRSDARKGRELLRNLMEGIDRTIHVRYIVYTR